ncbi:MAG TPA: hypothetical protein VF173_30815 [Thermoanaerobaculia bacterium]|nr:hypothetical protein [Thermoanaerobaculia bacterium]
MAMTVQIRNVPDDLHRKLKARAASAGMSISEYLLRDLERSLSKPTPGELLERLRSHGRVNLTEPVEEVVAAEREGR